MFVGYFFAWAMYTRFRSPRVVRKRVGTPMSEKRIDVPYTATEGEVIVARPKAASATRM
jgi:hypothetical protein